MPQQCAKLVRRQSCQARESCVQAFQLRFAHGLQIDAGRLCERLRALHPTQKDFGSAGIIDGTLTETALDIGVRGGLTVSPAGARAAGTH